VIKNKNTKVQYTINSSNPSSKLSTSSLVHYKVLLGQENITCVPPTQAFLSTFNSGNAALQNALEGWRPLNCWTLDNRLRLRFGVGEDSWPTDFLQEFCCSTRPRISVPRITFTGSLDANTDLQYGKKLLLAYLSSHPLGALFFTACQLDKRPKCKKL
jgi:hypothetical protein